MKKLLLSFSILFLFVFGTVKAQVGINILQPDSNAILDLFSDEKGLLLPRLTTAQMTSMQNPTNGLVIYNTEDSLVYYFNNECWLKAYQKNCQECEFITVVNQGFATIDRTTTDTAIFELEITKMNGLDSIATAVLASLPQGMSVTVENPIIDSVGTVIIKVYASIWAPSGTYPIIIQSVCGQNVYFQGVTVEVEPCIEVNIASHLTDVDLQSDFSLPGVGTPVCVIVDVFQNVEISSTTINDYAMDFGNLDPMSHVGLLNRGYIYAKGGDGAPMGNLANLSLPFQDGEDGGDALNVTCRTTFDLQGGIYSGGGGGGTIGTSLVLGPWNISPGFPFPNITIGPFIILEVGAMGGGGSSGGEAQNGSGTGGTVLGYQNIAQGTDATVGPASIPGIGGTLQYSVPINTGLTFSGVGVNLNVTPAVGIDGGDGGAFGQAGQDGTGFASASFQVSASVFGFNIPIASGNPSITLGLSNGGMPGTAITGNGNTMQDLIVPNFLIKGPVQP